MLGQTFENNKSRSSFRPTVYGLKFKNEDDAAVDRTQIEFSMFNNVIKIGIHPLVKSQGDEYARPDRNTGGLIYLTPIKADMFSQIIEKFIAEEEKIPEKDRARLSNPYSGYEIPSKNGTISIVSGKDIGATEPCIVIAKTNENTGLPEATYAYQVKTKYHYAISQHDQKTGEFQEDTESFKYIELKHIMWQLRDFARAQNGAYAHAASDTIQAQFDFVNENLGKIAGSMGVTLASSNASSGSSRSYFDRNRGTTASSEQRPHTEQTIEDILGA